MHNKVNLLKKLHKLITYLNYQNSLKNIKIYTQKYLAAFPYFYYFIILSDSIISRGVQLCVYIS